MLALLPRLWVEGSLQVRYYGACPNRVRQRYRDGEGEVAVRPVDDEDSAPLPKSRASRALLIRIVSLEMGTGGSSYRGGKMSGSG